MDIQKIIHFLRLDIWRIREHDFSPSRWFLIRIFRIFILSLRGLAEDKLHLRASALTFYSLLSVVPVAAMIFGIAKGFGFQNTLERMLTERLVGQEEVITKVIEFSNALLENTKGSLIAGIGLVILFWTVIKVLSNIESSFNDIWGVKQSRVFWRKISDYLSLMLIGPVLFLMSSTVTVIITSQVENIVEKLQILGPVGPAILFLLKFLPYCVLWFLFAFIYIFMPNTKVSLKSGLLAGIIAGTICQVFQLVYINFQIGVTRYNAIYGSFAALPLFLVWLQLSWLIVLLGAEFSFAHQNVDTYEFEPDSQRMSHSFKKLLALRIVNLLVKDFFNGNKPSNEVEISKNLEVPIRCVRQILNEVVEAGIVSEIRTGDEKEAAYQPARDTGVMTIKYVTDTLERRGIDDIPIAQTDELKKIARCLDDFGALIEKSPANMNLKDI